jgi:hypothetical protein
MAFNAWRAGSGSSPIKTAQDVCNVRATHSQRLECVLYASGRRLQTMYLVLIAHLIKLLNLQNWDVVVQTGFTIHPRLQRTLKLAASCYATVVRNNSTQDTPIAMTGNLQPSCQKT